ncbi:MAG: DNA-binding response regulator [Wenzhouxiangella sp.]|nr:MAG: DNA-binding response regulator [Wenzhouxiangella sp.]
MRVLVVDDEAPAVRRLQRLLQDHPLAEFAGSASHAGEALEACLSLHPDVVLLDVEMPGMDGVSAARRMLRLDQPPQIVFVTAFEQYAVDAFDLHALDYLVKPVRAERLDKALRRAAATRQRGRGRRITLSARLGERLLAIPLDEVRVLLAEDKYTCVHYVGGEALIEDSLMSLEERFGEHFVRVHRAALVSRQHLRALVRDPDGHERVEVEGCRVRPEVSRRNLATIRRLLTS